MQDQTSDVRFGTLVEGAPFSVTRETIREFCDASLDYNPLHLDDDFMKGSFGKTQFGGIIMHGMTNFGIITKMITDWVDPLGGMHRRLETRWRQPVKPGDTIRASAHVVALKQTGGGRYAVLDVVVRNQRDDLVATGEALVELAPAPR